MPAAVSRRKAYLHSEYCISDNFVDWHRREFSETGETTNASHEKIVDDCLEYIETNLNGKITLEDLADVCGRDKFQVIRTFRRALGTTPHAYIVEARVQRAAQLLRSGEPAAEVASEVGFVDQSHLIRYFKRHVGTTPKRFTYQR